MPVRCAHAHASSAAGFPRLVRVCTCRGSCGGAEADVPRQHAGQQHRRARAQCPPDFPARALAPPPGLAAVAHGSTLLLAACVLAAAYPCRAVRPTVRSAAPARRAAALHAHPTPRPACSGVSAHGLGQHLHGRGCSQLPGDVQVRAAACHRLPVTGASLPPWCPAVEAACERASSSCLQETPCLPRRPSRRPCELTRLLALPLQVLPGQLPHASVSCGAAGGQPDTHPGGGALRYRLLHMAGRMCACQRSAAHRVPAPHCRLLCGGPASLQPPPAVPRLHTAMSAQHAQQAARRPAQRCSPPQPASTGPSSLPLPGPQRGLAVTDRLGLLGASVTQHPEFGDLLDWLMRPERSHVRLRWAGRKSRRCPCGVGRRSSFIGT